MLLREPERPFLVYSAGDGPDSLAAEARNRRLTSLLGRTRAEVLRLLGAERPLTTTELARAAGISLAGASQHASILREAGLVLTERHGGSVPHRASGRGAALL
ncbi:winged helix-turn-helix domain-containing protein [Amycolatopsis sp. NPDC089917]|uniref:ArsR/SmtB family transcription factor n=1 Tax=Amycolatopsis sp. NPDC089917 TaxID=3155187 RepID=UPI00343E5455